MTRKKYAEHKFRSSLKQRKIIDYFECSSITLKDKASVLGLISPVKRKADLPLYLPNKCENIYQLPEEKAHEEHDSLNQKESENFFEFPNSIDDVCLLLDKIPRCERCLPESSQYPIMASHESDMIHILLDNNQQHFIHAIDRAYSFRAVMPPDLLSKFIKIGLKANFNENEKCSSKLFAYVYRCIRLKSPTLPENRNFWRNFIASSIETDDFRMSTGEKLAALIENLQVTVNITSNVVFKFFIVLSEIVISDFDKSKYCTHLHVHNMDNCPISADLVWIDLATKCIIPRIALKLIRVLSSFLTTENFDLKLASSNLLRVLILTLKFTLNRERVVELLSQNQMTDLIQYCH